MGDSGPRRLSASKKRFERFHFFAWRVACKREKNVAGKRNTIYNAFFVTSSKTARHERHDHKQERENNGQAKPLTKTVPERTNCKRNTKC